MSHDSRAKKMRTLVGKLNILKPFGKNPLMPKSPHPRRNAYSKGYARGKMPPGFACSQPVHPQLFVSHHRCIASFNQNSSDPPERL
jgi:hypothetical protein